MRTEERSEEQIEGPANVQRLAREVDVLKRRIDLIEETLQGLAAEVRDLVETIETGQQR